MKFLLLPVLMALLAVAQVFCEGNEPREEADYWTSANQIQVVFLFFFFLFVLLIKCQLIQKEL